VGKQQVKGRVDTRAEWSRERGHTQRGFHGLQCDERACSRLERHFIELGADGITLFEQSWNVRSLRLLLRTRLVHLSTVLVLDLLQNRELGILGFELNVKVVVMLANALERVLRLVILLDHRLIR